MTKKDLITEAVEELIKDNVIAEKDRNLSVGIVMGVFTGFSIISNPYLLEDE